uniref:Basic salivary proline-rich protein 4-like n=1 Tax=Nicotiana sylvestris TaxID=4096 RepID=A0A1U7XEC4_NICSY
MNTQPYVQPPQQANRGQAPPPRSQPPYRNRYNPRPSQNNFRPREPPRRPNYTPIGEPYSTLFSKLVQMNLLQPIPPNGQNPESPSYQRGVSKERKPKATPKQEKGKADVSKQAYVVWGTIKPPRLNEPVVIGRIPQKPKYSKKKDDEVFTVEESEGIYEAMRKMLCKTHMVQPGEDTSTAE